MNHNYSPIIAYHPMQQGDNEIEALQTDIMRFMAILGLCLMAIFSIVQSLPYQQKEQIPGLESQTLMQNEVQLIQNQTQQLLKQVTKTSMEMQRAAVNFQKIQAQQQIVNQQLQLSRTDLQHTQAEFKQSQSLLQNIDKDLLEQQHRLSRIAMTLKQEQAILSQVRSKIDKEKRELTQHQHKFEQLKQVLASSQKKLKPQSRGQVKESPKLENGRKQLTAPNKIGFSLRFQSDLAFLQLLENNKIGLYVLMGQHAWKIDRQRQQWNLTPHPIPKQYYQMAGKTVPQILHNIVNRQLSANPSTILTWGVSLPSQMATELSRLMRAKQGGDLIIDNQGTVLIND